MVEVRCKDKEFWETIRWFEETAYDHGYNKGYLEGMEHNMELVRKVFGVKPPTNLDTNT